jgi:uncharacterized membrane protein
MSSVATPTLHKPISLHEFRLRRRPRPNPHKEVLENLSPLTKLAVWITGQVGTMGFFLTILLWTAIWLGWNFFAPERMRFDPPMGFIFYLFISNVIQILLMPLIMVGQNIQGAHSEARAEHDLAINVKAEEEIEIVLHHLEHQNQHLEHQNELLMQMVEKLGINIQESLAKR